MGSKGTFEAHLNKKLANPSNWTEASMDQSDDPREIERKIAQASRVVPLIADPTTRGWLAAWIEELRQKLRRHREGRRIKEDIRKRAQELWELEGRPGGRDLEFWLKAESEINGAS